MSHAIRGYSIAVAASSSPGAVLLEQAHDLGLFRLGLRRAAAAAAGGLRRKTHWRRAILVLAFGIGAAVDERAHGGGAAGAHGAVQRRDPAHVEGVGIGVGAD